MLIARVLISMLAYSAVVIASPVAEAQSPGVTEGCGRTGHIIDGGQTGIGQQTIVLTVLLPETGTFYSVPARPDEAPVPSLFVCHVESGSSIVIDGTTGQEVTRTVGDPSGTTVLNQISAAVHVESVVRTPPPSPDGSTFTPPITGDAGLKR